MISTQDAQDISSLARPSTQRAAQSKGAYNQAARREEGPGGRGWNAGVVAGEKETGKEEVRKEKGKEVWERKRRIYGLVK